MGYQKISVFIRPVTNEKFRTAIDGVIDQFMVQSIAEKLNLPPESIESRLIALSIDSALLPEKVLAAIDRKTSLASIPNLVMDREFIKKLESHEAYLHGIP